MASSNLQVVISAKDMASGAMKGIAGDIENIGKHATQSTSLIGGFTNALGSIGLAAMGIGAISGAVQGLLSDAIDAQKVQASLNAVLTSTHGISGMTADSVNALADSLSKVTPFEDEAIGGAENMLLTFTNIGRNVFPQATEAVLNMSQALGQDLQSSSIQLGKALNDPVAGVTALQRVGVKLTDSQKELIKSMVASGNIMGAQKVILGELQTEFGGAAKAAGETFAGKMAILNTQIGNVKEAIGGPLLTVISGLVSGITPAISAFATGLPDAINTAQNAITSFARPAIDAVQKFLAYLAPDNKHDLMTAWFGPNFGPRIDDVTRGIKGIIGAVGDIAASFGSLMSGKINLGDFIGKALGGLSGSGAKVAGAMGGIDVAILGWITAQIPKIGAQLLTWGQAFLDWVTPMIPKVRAELDKIIGGIKGWITAQASMLPAHIREWERAFIDWVNPMIPKAITELGKLTEKVRTWVTGEAPKILAQLNTWGEQFTGWVSTVVPKIPGELAKLGAATLTWIDTQTAPIRAQVQKWATAFVDWIQPATADFLTRWPIMLNQFLDWIQAQAAPIIKQLGVWATAFVAWIVPATIDFLSKWPGMLNKFLDWIETAAPPLIAQLATWAGAFISWIVPMIPDFLLALAGISLAIFTFVAETLVTIGLRLLKWGAAFIEWIVPQIPGFIAELGKIAEAIIKWIADQAVALAPKLLDLGAQLARNLVKGLLSVQLPNLTALVTGGTPGIPAAIPPPPSTPYGSSSSSNNVTNNSTTAPNITVNVNGNNVDPTAVSNQTKSGVLAAGRAMGYS